MKINVGIRENGETIMFVTDDKENNIGEMNVSKELYELALKEWSCKNE